MDAAKALKIVRALADGRDPSSGATLSRESVFQKPEVIRAMFAAAALFEREIDMLPGVGGAWSPEEEARLVASLEKGVSQADIAREHGRTRGAIHSRLKKLGLVDNDGDTPPSSRAPSPSFNRKPDDDVPF